MQGQRITLQGDLKLYQSLVSLKSMVRAMQVGGGGGGGQGILVEYGSVELVEATVMEGVPTSIRAVLEKYEAVCQTPQGLPPQRNRGHVITLKGGTAPINVRLTGILMYRSKKLRSLWEKCLSPILLVKKKGVGGSVQIIGP